MKLKCYTLEFGEVAANRTVVLIWYSTNPWDSEV